MPYHVWSSRSVAAPFHICSARIGDVQFHRIAGLTRGAVSVESEKWRLIGCVALRVGLHEGDGQLEPLGIEEVGDTMRYVLSNLTVQHVKHGDTITRRPVFRHLIEPVENHLPAKREPLHPRGIPIQQFFRVVHLRVVTRHVLILSTSCIPWVQRPTIVIWSAAGNRVRSQALPTPANN